MVYEGRVQEELVTLRWAVIGALGLVASCQCGPTTTEPQPCKDGGVCSNGFVCCRDGTCRGVCPAPDGGGAGGRAGGLAGGGLAQGGGSTAGGASGGQVAGGGALGGGSGGGAPIPDGGCTATLELSCLNGLDDDCDSLLDCADPDCDTRPCTDGLACTTTDRCTNSICTGTISCASAPSPCFAANGSCQLDGGCGYAFLDDAGCDDADRCTTNDRCSAGTCRGTTVSCTSPPTCFASPGTCNPQTGQCVYGLADAGTVCDDNDLCTSNDRCVDAGVCRGSPRCAFVENPCLSGVCDPTSGVCTAGTNVANGTACRQEGFAGFGCPTVGTCMNGTCTGSSPAVPCNDFNQCTVNDTCTPTGTCQGTMTTGACDDGNSCTTNDHCTNGSCAGTARTGTCDDNNPCTMNESCSNGTCQGGAMVGAVCDDGNDCTINDVCMAGQCRGTPLPAMTQVGPSPVTRCCINTFTGTMFPTDISATAQHCGGCGIDCGGMFNFFGCVPTAGAFTCGAPPSGRCACAGTAAMPAPAGSWVCQSGVWVPQTAASCLGGNLVAASGTCPAYCAP